MSDKKYLTRMGDGEIIYMTKDEIREDVLAGMEDAVKKGKSEPMSQNDVDYMVEILTDKNKIVGVEPGYEGVTVFDAGTLKVPVRSGVPVDRSTDILIHERVLMSDSMELCHPDYSWKAIKNIAPEEAMMMEQCQMNTIIPLFYGAMPNMGLYTKPDGPYENWSELLPQGKIKEAMEAQELAADACAEDMIYIASMQAEAGADGIQFDTAGAAGDADYLAALKAAKVLSEKYPDLCITMGMANEFTLGMHGKLKFEGQKLAGTYPAKQVKICESAGVHSYGCVVNTNSSRSFAWNLARATTYVQQATKVADIPVLVDAGMGVGGVPLTNVCPVDASSRVAKCLMEIGKADGLQIGHGDAFGMAATYEMAMGLQGTRAAGDLVARMVFKGMKIADAKAYVAKKLNCTVEDLSDCYAMKEIRESLDIGHMIVTPHASYGMAAKIKIAEILDIKIPSVENFKKQIGLK